MSKRILLCDDEVHIMRAAEFKFRRAGYQVSCATDGQEAWEMIVKSPPDLLITDYQMPRLNGGDLCRQIRAHSTLRNLPIIILTGKGFEIEYRQAAEQWNVLALVSKPFSPRELLQLVEQHFAEAALANPGAPIETPAGAPTTDQPIPN